MNVPDRTILLQDGDLGPLSARITWISGGDPDAARLAASTR